MGLCNHVWIVRNKSPPVLTETLTDKKVKIGELVELGIAGMLYVPGTGTPLSTSAVTSNTVPLLSLGNVI